MNVVTSKIHQIRINYINYIGHVKNSEFNKNPHRSSLQEANDFWII